jgi:AAA domain
MQRVFNTAGPCDPARHYMVPPLPRLPEAEAIVEQQGYFVVHAPRQSGKTTTLRALARALTEEGACGALHFSCEAGEAAGDDLVMAQRAVLDDIRRSARHDLPADMQPPDPWPEASEAQLLAEALSIWAERCPRPLVLFFDEIDALRGESLRAVLRQLRAGFPRRPEHFPASVALCGLRDVRDYKAASGGDPGRLGTSSPFNIKLESLRLGNFDADDVRALYAQHAEETRQAFEEQATARAFELTGGQPWLVNALAREVVEKLGLPPGASIGAAQLEEAKERLILARATHLDSLAARLQEPRVRRVIEPLLAGELVGGESYDDDYTYVRDLGLVSSSKPIQIANPIYREVIARVLSAAAEDNIELDPRAFVLPDGRLDMRRLLEEFADFWREHGESLLRGMPYPEAAPQLVLMGYLQRVVNGGGYVDREYGVGRGRIDLCVRWPFAGADGKRAWQRAGLELKVWRDERTDPLGKGLEQLDGYLARLGLDQGVLVIFDARERAAGIAARTGFSEERSPGGLAVLVLRA